ncbi:hypothetical protein GCM10025876_25090 [Demequina litorisediminis]|uniref:Uncharacterized protein n=1 Tax=Demequina litorisediminis TaxID=1849022 RepID=A0ABQ6IES2_9MICO|nr:hypothetical protein GCM10025876_25090 [Demequina litorisediminis]
MTAFAEATVPVAGLPFAVTGSETVVPPTVALTLPVKATLRPVSSVAVTVAVEVFGDFLVQE